MNKKVLIGVGAVGLVAFLLFGKKSQPQSGGGGGGFGGGEVVSEGGGSSGDVPSTIFNFGNLFGDAPSAQKTGFTETKKGTSGSSLFTPSNPFANVQQLSPGSSSRFGTVLLDKRGNPIASIPSPSSNQGSKKSSSTAKLKPRQIMSVPTSSIFGFRNPFAGL